MRTERMGSSEFQSAIQLHRLGHVLHLGSSWVRRPNTHLSQPFGPMTCSGACNSSIPREALHIQQFHLKTFSFFPPLRSLKMAAAWWFLVFSIVRQRTGTATCLTSRYRYTRVVQDCRECHGKLWLVAISFLLALNAGTTLVRFEYLRSTAQIATASFYISAHATASHSVRVSMAESEEIFLSIFSFYFTDGCLFPVKKCILFLIN